jgi:SAM-dependent methyltransferase
MALKLADAKPDAVLSMVELVEYIIDGIHTAGTPDPLVKFDLGCGETPMDGFRGVDLNCTADVNADLFAAEWSFTPDDSVDMLYSSHFVEHIPRWNDFFEAAWRKMKAGGLFLITTPYGSSNRAWQDPDHKQIIFEERYLYLSKNWLDQNRLGHYSARVDFEIVNMWPIWNADFVGLNPDTQNYAMKHYRNAVDDLTVLLRAKK